MVSLPLVQSSKALRSSTLPSNLVAVFIGATSGIGEATLKQFAKHARRPRAYFVGRSQDAGDRIGAECNALNPEGEFIFIKADVSLMRVVDGVCEKIKAKEKAINILFLSAGVAVFDRRGGTYQHFSKPNVVAKHIRICVLISHCRNLGTYPLVDRPELLLPHPLHDQPHTLTATRFRPPPRRHGGKRRIRRPTRPIRFPRQTRPTQSDPWPYLHPDDPRT